MHGLGFQVLENPLILGPKSSATLNSKPEIAHPAKHAFGSELVEWGDPTTLLRESCSVVVL